jgi:Tfp pilus assembly protein PilN
MIELYDPARLRPRRDPTLPLAGGALALVMAGLGAHTWQVHTLTQRAGSERAALQARLDRIGPAAPEPSAPSNALIADLQRQVERLEADVRAAGGGAAALPPSQWLSRLAEMARDDVALRRIEIDRAGAARIEGQARSAQAVNDFVQAWDRHQGLAAVHARTIELREDPQTPGLLGFVLTAEPAGVSGGAAPTPGAPATDPSPAPGLRQATAPAPATAPVAAAAAPPPADTPTPDLPRPGAVAAVADTRSLTPSR